MKAMTGTLQGGGASFNTTHWTVVLRAGQCEQDRSAQQALAAFCEAYWPPLYSFLRYRRYTPEDAQDLVQGFFAHLLAQNALSRADREKGRLRTFLLGSLQNYLSNEYDRAHALKRGGGHQIVSFDEHLPEAEAVMRSTAHLDEVSCYDLSWASNVIARAWQRLGMALADEGKGEWFDALKPFLAGGTTVPPNQEETAARMNVPVATLRTWISRLRQRYREALRAEVGSTVSDPAEIDGELQYLYRLLME
jgi:RNA polymerase sigma-70 factor (ECF subfamily)